MPQEAAIRREDALRKEHHGQDEGALKDANWVEIGATKGPNQKHHWTKVSHPHLESFPHLGPEEVIRLRVVKQVNPSDTQEAKEDGSDYSELDGCVPFKVGHF